MQKKSGTEGRNSETEVNFRPKIGTVPLKAGQLEGTYAIRGECTDH